MRKLVAAVAPIVFGLAILGCQGDKEGATPQTPQDPKPADTSSSTSTANENLVAFAGIQSLMDEKCVMCHGTQPKEGVDLRSHESIMKGGEHGAIVVPGKPEESLIIKMVRGAEGHDRMPPQGAPLTEEQIATLETWIRQGANAS